MIEAELIFIEEPKLKFGFGQEMTDPRDGLTLYGAFSQNSISGQINVGIIGPEKQRGYLTDYLDRIHKPVNNIQNDIARPYFPGLQSAFNVFINFNAIQEIEVERKEIDEFLKYTDSHQRVFNLSNLYADKLKKFSNEEHQVVNVWFVVIPNEIYTYGRPKSRIPASKDNIKIGLRKSDRDPRAPALFDEINDLKIAYEYEINFHNQLKAKLLEDKIVTQIIRESTIAYDRLWDDQKKIEKERIFDTAKAWNISTTLYYKVGGIPWKLNDIRSNVCYLGLVYKRMEFDPNPRNACCAAQMFLDSGDGMVFRGNIGPWYNPQTKEYHISRDDAFELLSKSLEAFRDKSETDEYPEEIFIHAKTYFDDNEWEGFLEASSTKSHIIGVRIRNDNTFKLYREFSYSVPRGTALIVGDSKAYLWTNGFIPRLQTQLGLETPNPISIEVTRGKKNIATVCKDVLALTKLNYNTCIYGEGSPMTLSFADSIGEVLTAGKDIKSEVLPFKHYV